MDHYSIYGISLHQQDNIILTLQSSLKIKFKKNNDSLLPVNSKNKLNQINSLLSVSNISNNFYLLFLNNVVLRGVLIDFLSITAPWNPVGVWVIRIEFLGLNKSIVLLGKQSVTYLFILLFKLLPDL